MLSTPKFEQKAKEVMRLELESSPKHVTLKKFLGSEAQEGTLEMVELSESSSGDGGMMLYTSGTTARPVSIASFVFS